MTQQAHTLLNIHYSHVQENSFAIHIPGSNASTKHFCHYGTNQTLHLSKVYLFFAPMLFLFHFPLQNIDEHKAGPATYKMFPPGQLRYLFCQMVLLYLFPHSTNVAMHREIDLQFLKNGRSSPIAAALLFLV